MYGIPNVTVNDIDGYPAGAISDDQVMATVIECTKGTPNQVVLVRSQEELTQQFHVDMSPFWQVEGQALLITRAASDIDNGGSAPVKAQQKFYDTNSTAKALFTLIAKQPGSYKITVKIEPNAISGYNVTIGEAGFTNEYHIGIATIDALVKRINSESKIVDAVYIGEPTSGKTIATISAGTVLGSSGVVGTDGSANGQAIQTYKDTNTTAKDIFKLQAKFTGTNAVTVTVADNVTTGTDVTIACSGYLTETYTGLLTVQALCNAINGVDASGAPVAGGSKIVDAIFIGEFTVGKKIAAITGTLSTVGSIPDYAGQLGSLIAPVAHAKALLALEQYKVSAVFCTQVTENTYDTIFSKYVEHVDKTNSAEYHGWRLAILGATPEMDKAAILNEVTDGNKMDRETVVFVGQGLIAKDGRQLSPVEATQVVAGKMSSLAYYDTIWGGKSTKILGLKDDGSQYIVDVVPMPGTAANGYATKEDEIEYNEKGVLAFTDELDGIRIREGVTTAQNGGTGEDEIAIMRIIRHVKYLVYNRAYEMLGQNITSTYKIDLEEYIKSGLEEMKSTDNALVDVPESGLSAYSASVTLQGRTAQREGKVSVSVSVTPVHAARTINATVTVL